MIFDLKFNRHIILVLLILIAFTSLTFLIYEISSSTSRHNVKKSQSEVEIPVETVHADNRGNIIFSHVLYRHGDRNIFHTYPNDPYAGLSNWPEGFGELTNKGKKEQYELGKWLRRRYVNYLIDERYNSNEITVESSDQNRCIASAQINLAGLYPPVGDQLWNGDIFWQPIPIHTVPKQYDYKIASFIPACPMYEIAIKDYELSPEFLELNESLSYLFEYVTNKSGMNINSIYHLLYLRDSFTVETGHNKILPEWTQFIYPNHKLFNVATLKYFTMFTETATMAKFRIGFLLKDILDRSNNKTIGLLNPNYSMWMYSTHDIVLSSLLNALGVFDNKFIGYAACVMIEVHLERGDVPHLKMFYKNPNLSSINIPNCGYSCPLARMYELFAHILPTQDFQTSCSA